MILGAGASYDAASVFATGGGNRPPLVKELFEDRFYSILSVYPMAKNAAPEIRDAIGASSQPGAVSLENHLRTQYRNSTDELDLRRFYSIVLYLQHVLLSVSSQGAHFDNLDRLLSALLRRFDHVCFVTLNYDLLLDRCLSAIAPLTSLGDFIRQERWSLVKLHGSVTWGREIQDAGGLDLRNPPADLEERLGDEIFHSWGLDLDTVRIGDGDGKNFNTFPALSAPLGAEDELTCPPEHLEFLHQRLTDREVLDLLVIGYSAYDQAVIDKLNDAGTEVRSLMVVNQGRDAAEEVSKRLAKKLGISPHLPDWTGERFGVWVRGELAGFLAHHQALR